MSKIKVYELAKELGLQSKDLVEFLKGKEIEVKSHMSSVEEGEAAIARKAFAKEAKAEKKPEIGQEAKAEAKPAEKVVKKPESEEKPFL